MESRNEYEYQEMKMMVSFYKRIVNNSYTQKFRLQIYTNLYKQAEYGHIIKELAELVKYAHEKGF